MPRSRPRALDALSRFSLLGACLALAVATPAQIDEWASIPVNGGTTAIEQSLVVVQENNTVRAFSCLTRSWTSITTVRGAPMQTLLNEHLIVRDGAVFFGYSPRTAAFTPLYTSPNAWLVPSSSPQTYCSVVVDGNRVHAYFAFTGQWSTYTFAAPPTVTMGRFCFLVTDGATTWAASCFYGTLVVAPVAAAAPLRADGNMGFATSASAVHGFSAATNTWSSLPVAGPPAVSVGNTQPALAAVQDGSTISLFSGHTGTFRTLPAAPTATVQLQRYVAIVVDGGVVYGYSGLLGEYAVVGTAPPASVVMQQMYALVDDGTGIRAFSAATGGFAAPFAAPLASTQTTAQVAVAMSSTAALAVYSSLRNRWDPLPAVPSASLYQNAVAVVLVDPNGGVYGWSQRGSGWVFAPTNPIDTVVVGTNPPNTAETIYLRSGNTLHTFNPRTEHWRSASTAAPAALVRAHYQALLAQDGTNAYAFSIWNDRWSTQPLQGGFVAGTAQVQSAYAKDAAAIHAYGGFGQLSMLGEFPDLYRAATAGMPFRQDVVAEAGALVILGASLAGAELPVPGIGTLLLDPPSLVILMMMQVPNCGMVSFTMPVPAGVTGLEPHFQAAVFGANGAYFTNSVFPTFL